MMEKKQIIYFTGIIIKRVFFLHNIMVAQPQRLPDYKSSQIPEGSTINSPISYVLSSQNCRAVPSRRAFTVII